MTKGKKISLLVFSAFLLVLCLFLYCKGTVYYTFSNICGMLPEEETDVIVDCDDDTIYVFQMEGNCAVTQIRYPKSQDNLCNLPRQLFTESGKTYLCNTYHFVGEETEYIQIYQLDFKRKKRTLLAEFNPETDLSMIAGESGGTVSYQSFSVVKDRVYLYFYQENEEEDACAATYAYDGENWVVTSTVPVSRNKGCLQMDKVEDGYLYRDESGKIHKITAEEDTAFFGTYTKFYLVDENNLIGKNLRNKELEMLDLTTGEAQPVEQTLTAYLTENQISMEDINRLEWDGDRMLLAYRENGLTQRLLVYENGTMKDQSTIRAQTVLQIVWHCAILAVLILFAEAVVLLLFWLLKKYGTVLRKLIVLLLPVMGAAVVVSFYGLFQMLAQRDGEELISFLDTAALRCASALDVGEIADFSQSENPNFPLVYEKAKEIRLLESHLSATLEMEESGQQIQMAYFGYDTENQTYLAVDTPMSGDTIEDTLPSGLVKEMLSAIERDGVYYFNSVSEAGEKLVNVAIPTKCGEEKNGILWLSTSSAELTYQISPPVSAALWYEILILFAIVVIFVFITYASLRSLRRLRKKAVKLTGGEAISTESSKPPRYFDEVSILSGDFDRMVQRLQAHMEEIDCLRLRSKAYFPDSILHLLGRKKISELCFQEQSTQKLYVVDAFLPEKYDEFSTFHALMETLSPQIEAAEGILAEQNGRQITWMSANPDLGNLGFSLRQQDRGILVAVDCCTVSVSIFSCGENHSPCFSIEEADKHKMLLQYLFTMEAGFVCSGNVAQFAETKQICHWIGMLAETPVYEIFTDATERGKKLSRQNMKDGVTRFFQGDYSGAREQFVIALKYDRENRAAKYYINQIDQI